MSAVLKYGDVVTLTGSSCGDTGIVCSDGFVTKRAGMFRDCLFTVKPALLFDAAKELEKFLKAQQELATGGGPTDPRKDEAAALAEKEARAEREAVLRYAVEKETASNASKKSLHGSRVAYGNSVLLRHVKSRGFLSLVSKSVAELEAACTLVALRPVPSPAALFEVSPRYKLRSHGQAVSVGDQIVLLNSKSGLALHVSDVPYADEGSSEDAKFSTVQREVNASATERAGFRVSVYADFGTRADCVFGGGFVRLWHAEAEGALALNPSFDPSNASTGGADASAGVHVRCIQGDAAVADIESSNALWAVELTADATRRGGPLAWEPDDDATTATSVPFRLRHVGTGLYLSVGSETDTVADMAAAGTPVTATAAAAPPAASGGAPDLRAYRAYRQVSKRGALPMKSMKSVPAEVAFGEGHSNTLFRMVATQAQSGTSAVPANCTMRLCAADGEFCGVRTLTTRLLAAAVPANVSALPNSAQIVRVPVGTQSGEARHDEDAFVVRIVGQDESAAVAMALSARATLVHVLVDVRARRETPARELHAATEVVAGLICFLLGVSDKAEALTVEGTPAPDRQRILREQRVLNIVADLLEQRRHEGEPAESVRLVQHCYRLMAQAFRDNPRNEQACTKWLPLMFRDACAPTASGSSTSARDTLIALLGTSRAVLAAPEHRFAARIDELCSKLAHKKEVRFLKILCALCAVGNEAVETHQNIIADRLLRNLGAAAPRAPAEAISGFVVRYRMTPGVGEVGVEMSAPDFDAGAWVPVEAFLKRADEDMELIDFTEAIPELFRHLCFKRNMMAIEAISLLVPYDVALHLVMAPTLKKRARFRARLLGMIEHCYVCCDPWVEKIMPVYTRVLRGATDSTAAPEDYDAAAHKKFGTLRDWALSYIKDLKALRTTPDDVETNELSLAVVTIAKTLLMCGAYDDESMRLLVEQLVRLLEGEKAPLEVEVAVSKHSKKIDDAVAEHHRGVTSAEKLAAKCRSVMCEILCRLADVRVDRRITSFVSSFVAHEDAGDGKREPKTRGTAFARVLFKKKNRVQPAEGTTDDEKQIFNDLFHADFWCPGSLFVTPSDATVLMKLTLHSRTPQLSGTAFSALVRHYSQRRDALAAFEMVQLLDRPEDVASLEAARSAVADLRRAADTTEVWLSVQGDRKSLGRAMTAVAALRRLTAICCGLVDLPAAPLGALEAVETGTTGGRVVLPSLEGSEGSSRAAAAADAELAGFPELQRAVSAVGQVMLRNLHAHEVALELARSALEVLQIDAPLPPAGGTNGAAIATLRAAHRFFVAFLRSNPTNQSLLADALDKFVSHVPLRVGAERTLVALLRGNVQTIAAATESVPQAMIDMLVTGPRDACWLDPLFELVEVNGVPIKRNQLMVLRLLLASGEDKTVFLCRGAAEMAARTSVLTDMAVRGTSTLKGDLAYQGRLLLLLAKICSGRAHDAIAKCQVLLPLASCIENIVSLSHPALLATGGGLLAALLLAAYVDFVVAVYLESESPLVISDIVRISEALGEVLRVHLVATAPDALSGAWRDAIFRSVLPALVWLLPMKDLQKKLAALTGPASGGALAAALRAAIAAARGDRAARDCAIAAAKELLDACPKTEVGPAGAASGAAAPAGSDWRAVLESATSGPGVEFTTSSSTARGAEVGTRAHIFHALVGRLSNSGDIGRDVLSEFAKGAALYHEKSTAESEKMERLRALVALLDFDSTSVVIPALRSLRSIILQQDKEGVVVGDLLADDEEAAEGREEGDCVGQDDEQVRKGVAGLQKALVDIGAVSVLCKVLAGARDDDAVLREGLKLAVALLVGGNRDVQAAFLSCFDADSAAYLMMSRIHARMTEVGAIIRQRKKRRLQSARNADVPVDEVPDDDTNDDAMLQLVGDMMWFLQQLCEGQNAPLQNYLSYQTGAPESFNLVAAAAHVCKELEACADESLLPLLKMTLDFLIESMQGPCDGNQRVVADAKGIDAAVNLIAWTPHELSERGIKETDPDLEETRERALQLLLAVLEGRSNQAIQTRLANALDFGALRRIIVRAYTNCVEQQHKEINEATRALEAVSAVALHEVFIGRNAFDEAPLKSGFLAFMLMQQLADSSKEDDSIYQVSVEAFNNGDKKLTEGTEMTSFGLRTATMAEAAFWFFSENLRHVEIVRGGELERVYFPKPLLSNFLTDVSKQYFQWHVDRSSPQAKIIGLLEACDEFLTEMRHQQEMSQFALFRFVSRRLERLKALSFTLAVVINILLLLSYGVKDATTPDMVSVSSLQAEIINGGGSALGGQGSATAILVLGIIQTITSVAVVGIYFANFGPLIVSKLWAARVRAVAAFKKTRKGAQVHSSPALIRFLGVEKLWEDGPDGVGDLGLKPTKHSIIQWLLYYSVSLFYLFSDWTIAYYCDAMRADYSAYIVFTFLGNLNSPFWFVFHLTDFVYRFESLKNVVRAVTYNRVQLAMTLFLGLIVMYFYSVLGFNLLRTVYVVNNENRCDTLLSCFAQTVNGGWRSGGGVGDTLQPVMSSQYPSLYAGSVIFYLSFWALLNVIFLNVIFGVIVDTFATLRDNNKDQLLDQLDVCFVCGLGRNEFERASCDFSEHLASEHNLWAYVDMVIYLKVRDRTQLTGTEAYLKALIENSDTSWFPAMRALILSGRDGADIAPAPADAAAAAAPPAPADIAALVKEAVRAEMAKQNKARGDADGGGGGGTTTA